MNKTNPIGVRFRVDLLEKLKTEHGVGSPQKALVFYERFFVTWWELGKNVKFPLRKAAEAASAIPPIDDIEPKDRIKATAPAATKPKTLDELKSLCPANLTGWDRSEWIRAERQKYGI